VIIACDQCHARYKYDENRFEGKASKKVRCTKCQAVFEISNPQPSRAPAAAASVTPQDETISRPSKEDEKPFEATTRQKLGAVARRLDPSELKLPDHAKLSLAVIAGPESGRIFPIEKARVVIGRHDADINVDDPEISRQHAALEISGDTVTLVDLGSTNGTLMAGEPVKECPIENQGEFSIGGSTLMLIVTRQP
jgi:predicted Zn finger-like uncharacterized protein